MGVESDGGVQAEANEHFVSQAVEGANDSYTSRHQKPRGARWCGTVLETNVERVQSLNRSEVGVDAGRTNLWHKTMHC